MIPLAPYEPTSDPFKNMSEELSFYNKLKFFFPGLMLIPIRLFLGIACVAFAAICTTIATFGVKFDKKEPKPLKGWRAQLASRGVGIGARGLLFFLGFHRVKIIGKPAPRSQAPIVVANHAAPWEAFALMYYSSATFVSRAENAKIPLFGTVMRGVQTIVVDRANASSRDFVVNEIKRRAADERWPPVGIFPEGTTINTKQLLMFRNGAFQPGLPVQPVIVRYPWKHLDPTWSGMKLGLGTMAIRLCTQFYNSMELHYLPVYIPSKEEAADPDLYAMNVRKRMAQHGNIQESPYSIEDYFLLLEAKKLGIDQEDATLGMHDIKLSTHMSVSDIKDIMQSFNKMDASKSGKINFQDFIKTMGIPDTEATRQSFLNLANTSAQIDARKKRAEEDNRSVSPVPLSPRKAADKLDAGAVTVDFRQFLQSVVYISREISTDEQVQMAFQIVDVDGDGKITPDELEAIMTIISPEMSKNQIKELFKKIDTRRVGYVDLTEFGSFLRRNPVYMQLFETVRESQRAMGNNAVLEMLAAREAGTAMSLEQFNARVQFYRELEKELAKSKDVNE